MLRLRWQTPPGWFEVVQSDFVAFLQDHAANERKVSQSALVYKRYAVTLAGSDFL